MHVQTMEGLVGAKTNMDIMSVPMRVFKDARRRGDTAVMERALGYAGDFAGKAQEYKKLADEGMEKDALEAREKAKAEREKAPELPSPGLFDRVRMDIISFLAELVDIIQYAS